MSRLGRGGLAAALLIGLLGCGPTTRVMLPPPGADPSEEGGYRLQPGDEVSIQVFREPELSGRFALESDGLIRHPLLGGVELGGLTADAAQTRITELLAEKYLVNPRVILKIESMKGAQILIMGQVGKPGSYSMGPGQNMTVLQAIAMAGGFSSLASPNRVRIVRTVDGRQTTINVRAADVLAGKIRHRDIPLEPNDIVVVPEIRF